MEAWKSNGGENKAMVLKVQLSYDKSEEGALEGGHEQWRSNIFESDMLTELRYPKQFDQAGKYVKPDEITDSVNVSSDPEQHLAWLQDYIELGFREIVLHNVNKSRSSLSTCSARRCCPG